MGRKYGAINLFKVIFILLIVVHHSDYLEGVLQRGYIAVEYFFMISGFFLCKMAESKKEMSVWTYTKRRFIKLYPHYIFSFIIIFIAYLAAGLIKTTEILTRYIPEIFLVQNIGIRYSEGGINYPCWYMSVLFYASIVIFAMLKYIPKKIFIIITGVCSILTYCAFFTIYGKAEGFGYIGNMIYMPFWRGFSEISIGAVMYWVSEWLNKSTYEKYKNVFRCIEVISLVAITVLLFTEKISDMILIVLFIMFIICITSPYAVFEKAGKTKVVDIGIKYEYSMFLNHALLCIVFNKVTDRFSVPAVVVIPVLLICLFVYSIITTKFINFVMGKIQKKK